MDAKTFFDHFGLIASAPNGVDQLRRMILQLAVQGKFSSSATFSESAEALLQEALTLKAVYEVEHNLRRNKRLSSISSIEIPFDIPEHWRWERLDNIATYIQRGKSPKYDDFNKHAYVVSQKCVQWSSFSLDEARGIDESSLEKYSSERFLTVGDLLWNSTGGGTAGRACTFDGRTKNAVADSHVTVIRLSNFNSKYIWCFLASPNIQERFDSTHPMALVSGTTNQIELATKSVKSLAIPCPPREEQDRIVATVEHLLEICDRLEALNKNREKLQERTSHAIYFSIAQSKNKIEFQKAWGRLTIHFPDLTSGVPELQNLKQLLRQLSLMGYLTPINSFLLADEILKNNQQEVITESDWKIPENWIWCKTTYLGQSRLGKMLDKQKNSGKLHDYLRNKNVQWRRIDLSDLKKIRLEDEELPRVSLEKNDLVICEGGEPGRAAIWKKEEPIVIQKALHRFRCNSAVIPAYLLLCLETDYHSTRLARYYTGTTIKHLTGRALAHYSVPLPPTEIQECIVESVEKLFNIFDSLEKQLNDKRLKADKLAFTSIRALTGLEVNRRKTMKAPKTEVTTELSIDQTPPDNKAYPLYNLLKREGGKLTAKALWQASDFGETEINPFYQQLRTEIGEKWIKQGEITVQIEQTEGES